MSRKALSMVVVALAVAALMAQLALTASSADFDETKLTGVSSNHCMPSVSGRIVVWQDDRNGNWDIYLYDLGPDFLPGTGDDGGEVPLCTSAGNQTEPSIDGSIVVWTDEANDTGDVHMYDLGADLEPGTGDDGGWSIICSDPGRQYNPDVHGDYVAWQVEDESYHYEVYLHRISTGVTNGITAMMDGDQTNPAIWGDIVVFESYPLVGIPPKPTHPEISYYTISTDTVVTIEDPQEEVYPDIYESTIVYMRLNHTTSLRSICVYDVDSGTESTIATSSILGLYGGPQVHGDFVAYTNHSTVSQLDLHRLSTATTISLLSASGVGKYPSVSDSGVVWQDERSSPYQIYIASIPDEEAPSIDDGTGSPLYGEPFAFLVSAVDDRGVASVSVEYEFDGPNATSGNISLSLVGPGVYNSTSISVPKFATVLNYTVWASDPAGNWGSAASSRNVSKAAPTVIDCTNTTLSPATGESFPVLAMASDEWGVGAVHVVYWFDGGEEENLSMALGLAGKYAAVIEVPEGVSVLHYYFTVQDVAGNWNRSEQADLAVYDSTTTPGDGDADDDGEDDDLPLGPILLVVVIVIGALVVLLTWRSRSGGRGREGDVPTNK